MANGTEEYGYNPANFEVRIDGLSCTDFDAFTSPGDGVELLYQGGAKDIKLQNGRRSADMITLSRPLRQNDTELFKWYNDNCQKKNDRRSGSIIYKDDEGNEVAKVELFGVWPKHYRMPGGSTSMGQSTVACEEVDIVVERMERKA